MGFGNVKRTGLPHGLVKRYFFNAAVDYKIFFTTWIINPLPVQFKYLLHGHVGWVFFQWAFKFTYVPVRLSTFSPAGDI
jgi:hypothetical protein